MTSALLRALLLVAVACLSSVATAARCSIVSTQGTTYDLSAITNADPITGKETNFDRVFTFVACDSSTVVSRCASDQAAACVSSEDGAWLFSAGKFMTQSDLKSVEDTADGVQIVIENKRDFLDGALRVVLTGVCGSKADATVKYDRTVTPKTFEVTAKRPEFCKGGGGGSSGGLSGGWIFIIILLSVSFVYVVAGCLINWRLRGRNLGKEACPNAVFWTALPGLAKDGVVFTVTKIKACCGGRGSSSGGGGDNYDTV